MRFIWAAPNKWMWVHAAEPAAGAITDGTTNVIIEDGVAVLVTDQGEVGTTHRLRNLLRPRGYDFEGWELGPVSAGTAIGRSAWFFNSKPTIEGKIDHELAFDAESGVILFMRSDESYLGFEELELDVEISDETFRWTGPVEPRKVGSALVIHEDDGTHSVLWEISVRGRSMFHQDGPTGLTKDEALAWGEERAARTHIRPESTRR
ncbi:MAG: hypothetical protein ACR2KQ_05845 [Actinomycetota bacterium]